MAAVALALLTCAELQPAARALAQAASPFPDVLLPPPEPRSHTWTAVSFISGAALIGASFGLASAGDSRYGDYLRATHPGRITDLYNDAVLFDRFSTASLIAGEVLIATGLYLAFLRPPLASRLGMVLRPSRCGVSLRF